jgi:hypothetical protein
MTMQEHLAAALEQNLGMLKMTLADFSDADLLVRPLPNANHTAWQLGHLICSERQMNMAAGAKMPALPPGFEARFTKETAKVDDPAAFPKKSDLFVVYEQQRKGTVAWVKGLSEKDLDAPGPEPMRAFCPTVASLAMLGPGHLAMHMGQMQVIRRKLGKPVLF